jgi:hypothetical protein
MGLFQTISPPLQAEIVRTILGITLSAIDLRGNVSLDSSNQLETGWLGHVTGLSPQNCTRMTQSPRRWLMPQENRP